MEYGLRINHHAPDHGRLILDGIRPALRAMARRGGGIGAALRPHWLDGPHVLIGLAPAANDAGDPWAFLADAVQHWLDAEPPRAPLDQAAFLARARTLAGLEGMPFSPGPIRPDRHIERDRFSVPDPLGEPGLAPLRDGFKAATLDDVFDLIELRLRSSSEALVELAFRIVCLERLAWRDGLNFWPLSLQGQAQASRRSFAGIAKAFPARLAELQPALLARVEATGALDDAGALPPQHREWLARLQAAYDALLGFLDTADRDFVSRINDRIMGPGRKTAEGLSRADAQTIDAMDHPTQFAYRMLMNCIYDMFPAIGFTANQRFLLCHLVTDMLETHFPSTLSRSYAHGAALCH